uniref:Phospholipase A(2) n=1 Tax=Acrobeloides nanus TaxID=290746 RepID=A0A914DUI4_9BILA
MLNLITPIRPQYYGNHCGKGVGYSGVPFMDEFDACCYEHDRCLEKWFIFFDILCHVDVVKCMIRVRKETGRPIPRAIVRGVRRDIPDLDEILNDFGL